MRVKYQRTDKYPKVPKYLQKKLCQCQCQRQFVHHKPDSLCTRTQSELSRWRSAKIGEATGRFLPNTKCTWKAALAFRNKGNCTQPDVFLSGKGKGLSVTRRTGRGEREIEVQLCTSLTSALDGGGWSTTRPGRFSTRIEPRYLWQKSGWAPVPI
jgi:hypothetical protein